MSADPTPSGQRIAVIGDIGGHADELRAELRRLGADDHGRLPPDLLVVQVGDLVHRGPDSLGVLQLVDGYLQSRPEQWVQLVGNHEAQYLREPAFEWPERLDGAAAAILQRWWRDRLMLAAVAISATPGAAQHQLDPGPDEQLLITHAGLTCGFWREVLDRLTGAGRAAAALNSLIGTHEDVLFHGGQMLGGARPDPLAGPIWAAAGTELLPSWLGVRMPFGQLHGHSTWAGSAGRPSSRSTAAELLRRTTVDGEARHETTIFDGGRIIGVDPGHGRQPRLPWRSWQCVGRLVPPRPDQTTS